MRYPVQLHQRQSLAWLVVLLAASHLVSTASFSQEPKSQVVADTTEAQPATNQLASDVQALKKSVERLEAKLDRLLTEPSDYCGVTIRVSSEAGKPLAGFQAKLVAQAKEGRYIAVHGTSDQEGLAVERKVPYGKYHLSLAEPTGWSTYFSDVVVEIGKDLELNIVAPDPNLRGQIVLVSKLREAAFTDLPFGETQEPVGSGYTVSYSPEPSELKQPWTSFPTVRHGVTTAGVRIAVRAKQDLLQSDGKKCTWNWSDKSSDGALVLVPGNVVLLRGIASNKMHPKDDAPFFTNLERRENVGFLIASEVKQLGDEHAIDVPTKEVEVAVTSILGKASPEVCDSLEQKRTKSVWLNVNLSKDSQWLTKLFDLREWEANEGDALIKRPLSLPAGEKVDVVLASPASR